MYEIEKHRIPNKYSKKEIALANRLLRNYPDFGWKHMVEVYRIWCQMFPENKRSKEAIYSWMIRRRGMGLKLFGRDARLGNPSVAKKIRSGRNGFGNRVCD